MSFANERQAIESRLTDTWTATSISYDNVPFDQPNDAAWIRLNIINGTSNYRAINSKKRHVGVIIIQCFAPINTGTSLLRGYADDLIAIFEDQIFNGIVCRVGSIATATPSDTMYQINVTIPYWRDD